MKFTDKWKVVPFNYNCDQQQPDSILNNNKYSEDQKAKLYNQLITKEVSQTTSDQFVKTEPTIKTEPTVKTEPISEPISEQLTIDAPRKVRIKKRKLDQSIMEPKDINKSTMDMDIEEDEAPAKNTRMAKSKKEQTEYLKNLKIAMDEMHKNALVNNSTNWAKYFNT